MSHNFGTRFNAISSGLPRREGFGFPRVVCLFPEEMNFCQGGMKRLGDKWSAGEK